MSALPYRWSGDALEPLRPKLCDKELVVGAVYWMEPEAQRSMKSHRHEFSWLREAWLQLPERLADDYPSSEHLRKRALIDAGFYNETIIDCGSKAGALRVAAFARGEDEFAVVITRGPVVVVRKAKSQSRRAMEPKEFQDSKTAILELVAQMIGVAPEALTHEAGRAA
jgi:hypothetical protein